MENKDYITASDLFSLISGREKMLVLDIRQFEEFTEYHVSGAVHVEPKDALDYLSGSDTSMNVPIIVISDLDEPALSLSHELSSKGYNSFYLRGGMEEGWFKLVRHIRIHEQK